MTIAAAEYLHVASHATFFQERDTVARGRLAGVVPPTCPGLMLSRWTRSETVFGADPPVEHAVEQLQCSACGAFVVVDRTADKVLNVYREPGLTRAEREADRVRKDEP